MNMQFLETLIFLIYHVILTQVLYFCKGICPTYLREPNMDNRLYISNTQMLNTTHMGECIQACSNDDVCTSFFYNHCTKQCALVVGSHVNITITEAHGWMKYQCYISDYESGKMFMYSSDEVTWDIAKWNCEQRNAFLAEPSDIRTSDFLQLTMQRVSKIIDSAWYWIGGSCKGEDAVCRWDHSTKTFWHPIWDNGSEVESNDTVCALLRFEKTLWQKRPCDEQYRYICQRETV